MDDQVKCPPVTTVDFETLPIGKRPDTYPPKPVSVSIREPGMRKAQFFAWGHPSGNNCSEADAKRIVRSIWKPGKPLLFFNGKFDVDVAETHFGCPRLPALDMHDGMFAAFLRDPHSLKLDLKSLSERWLNRPPEERDVIHEWAKKNKAALLTKFFTKPFKPGAYIGFAPGELVGPYANADVDMTLPLFKLHWDYLVKAGMLEAYQREQRIMPIFLDNERVGLRVDLPLLRKEVRIYRAALQTCDEWLRKRLKTKDLNLDNDQEVVRAFERNNIIAEEDWSVTASGARSISKDNLTADLYRDARVASAFGYRNRLSTCLKMFMEPWLEQAERRGGWISTNWNQVRGTAGGTRTGRPSTTDPNFLNISKDWDTKDDGYVHPAFISGLPLLPLVRKYILPDDAQSTFIHRDFNGQELRIAGHYEDGPLMQAYKENPRIDVHQYVADLILERTGKEFHRGNVKIANFRIIYGGGANATASGIGCSIAEAKELLAAHAKALPGIKGRGGLSDRTKEIGKNGEALYTWGGREYYVEPPSYSKKYKRHMTYEYKLLNYLVQGSAADATKEAIIRWHDHPKRDARFLVTVYDEINISAKTAKVKPQMEILRECMEGLEFDVPMLSDGKTGKSWGSLTKYKD